MKDLRKNTLDRLSESNQAEEYYSYEPKNAKLSDEQFIFTHDQNNEIAAKNFTGEEVNKKFEKLKEHREESLTVEKVQEITTSSGAANAAVASSSVTTAVAATTTAVIAVVGGGMVIQSVTYDPPKVSIAEVVGVTQNTISFNLGLVNDEGSEEGYCDCVIDLKCLSYDETQEIDIGELGTKIYEFEGLRPETEYTLSVYSKSFLDLDRKLLDGYEPITVTTLSDVTSRTIDFSKQLDPFEDTMFFVEFNNVEFSPDYASYFLEAYYPEDHQESYGLNRLNASNSDFLVDSVYIEDPTSRQSVNFYNVDPEEVYDFRLIAFIDSPTGVSDQEGDGTESNITVLAEETIDLGAIQADPFTRMDKTFLKRDGADEYAFDVYIGLTNTEGRSEYYLNFYDNAARESGQPLQEIYFENVNTVEQMYLDLVDVYTTYYVTLTCTTTNQADFDKYNEENPDRPLPEGTEEFNNFKIRAEEIDLSSIRRGEYYTRMYYAEPSVKSYGFSHDITIQTEASSYDDWTDLRAVIISPDTDELVSSELESLGDGEYRVVDSEEFYSLMNKYTLSEDQPDPLTFRIDAHVISTGEDTSIYTNSEYYYTGSYHVDDQLYFQKKVFNSQISDPTIKYFGFLGINDTYGYSDYQLYIYIANDDGSQADYLTYQYTDQAETGEGANCIFKCDDDVCGYFNEYEKFYIEVKCMSTRQADIDQWNQEHMGSETEEGPVEITLRSEVVDTNDFYYEEAEVPEATFVDIEIRRSFENTFVYVTIQANTFEYWSDLNINLDDGSGSDYAYSNLEMAEDRGTEREYLCYDSNSIAAFLNNHPTDPFYLEITGMDLLFGMETITIYSDSSFMWKGVDSLIEGAIDFVSDQEEQNKYYYSEINGAANLAANYTDFQIVFFRLSDYEQLVERPIDVTATNVHIACLDGEMDEFIVSLEAVPRNGHGEIVVIFQETITLTNV